MFTCKLRRDFCLGLGFGVGHFFVGVFLGRRVGFWVFFQFKGNTTQHCQGNGTFCVKKNNPCSIHVPNLTFADKIKTVMKTFCI